MGYQEGYDAAQNEYETGDNETNPYSYATQYELAVNWAIGYNDFMATVDE